MIKYIFGAGSLSLDVLSLICDLKGIDQVEISKKIKLVVDDNYYSKSDFYGHQVIRYSEIDDIRLDLIIAIGDPILRRDVLKRNKNLFFSESLVHSSASISHYATIGKGCIIHQNVIIGPNSKIGDGCVIYGNTSINHDVSIADFVTIGSNVSINGHCHINTCAFLGANSSIRQKSKIGLNCIIGMGSVVISDVPDHLTVAGNPAKTIIRRKSNLF